MKVPRPGYSARYTSPKTIVIQKSHIHHFGSGLLYSARSSSHWWPVVPTAWPAGRFLCCMVRRTAQATIEIRVIPAT